MSPACGTLCMRCIAKRNKLEIWQKKNGHTEPSQNVQFHFRRSMSTLKCIIRRRCRFANPSPPILAQNPRFWREKNILRGLGKRGLRMIDVSRPPPTSPLDAGMGKGGSLVRGRREWNRGENSHKEFSFQTCTESLQIHEAAKDW